MLSTERPPSFITVPITQYGQPGSLSLTSSQPPTPTMLTLFHPPPPKSVASTIALTAQRKTKKQAIITNYYYSSTMLLRFAFIGDNSMYWKPNVVHVQFQFGHVDYETYGKPTLCIETVLIVFQIDLYWEHKLVTPKGNQIQLPWTCVTSVGDKQFVLTVRVGKILF